MYSIGKFSRKIGVTVHTLRVWDKENKLKPKYVSSGGHRYYDEEQLNQVLQQKTIKKQDRVNVGYVRVSARHQKDDLDRQYQVMELYLATKGKKFKIISDIGSGINYKKKGLSELLTLVSTNQIDTLFIMYKDRLVRFGYELIEKICKIHDVKIEVINQSDTKSDEQEMIDDILNIIHVFSCRINGKRNDINKTIIKQLQDDK